MRILVGERQSSISQRGSFVGRGGSRPSRPSSADRALMKQHWHIRNCSLFEKLTPEQLALLEGRARIRTVSKGAAIYLPSDHSDSAILLGAGRVRIGALTPDGKQATLAFIEPGEIFGELALLQPGQREETAEAMAPSTIVLLPGEDLRRMMESSPSLALGVTKLIGLRRKRIEQRIRSLLFRSNRDRVRLLLLDLVEQYGRKTEAGALIDLPLSHQELAAIIGATRETVTLVLGELQLEEILSVRRQKVIVRDLAKLANGLDRQVPMVFSESPSMKATREFESRVLSPRQNPD